MVNDDHRYISRAIERALEAERRGNLPIGAVIVLDGAIIAEGCNSILVPVFHPGRHAEMEALRAVPVELWPRSREMTCYSTLEPCVMCFGALLLHGVGRIVFGAEDREGGATHVRSHLPPYYADGSGVPEWVGPLAADVCDELYRRAAERFERLPTVGRSR
ncbi:MAG TPA: nucleoside deaminase [Pyrinomonadaceae bacterium]|nr:nucleoside deaminase [Pyrinomonadaceae bacterium]